MSNTNCLRGFKCPNCGSLEPFTISVEIGVEIWDEGSDMPTGDIEWTDDSVCKCPCGAVGTVGDFQSTAA